MTAKPGASSQDLATANPDAKQKDAAKAQPSPLDDAAVAAYLKAHKDFFNTHQDLLLELSIPHESGKAVSLLERQVAVFRDRQSDLQNQFSEIISNARENDNLFEKTRLVILDLLHCSTLLSLNTMVEEKLKNDFDASASHLVFVSDHEFPQDSMLRCLPSSTVRAALGELYQKQRTYCGPLNEPQRELLFRDHPEPIISAAIVPLHLPEESPIRMRYGVPLILVGSVEAAHFNSTLDTLFLDFIGEVLAVHLHNLAAGV